MTRELPDLFIAIKNSIPRLDGNRIRVAERKITWSKLLKTAAGKTFEQAQAEYEAAGGDELRAGKGEYGQSDTSKAQYEAILGKGDYLPEGSEDLGIEVRAAIQGGKAVGVTIITNPPNPKMADMIDMAVRNLVFPNNNKMDFVTTVF
jgi:hypothetical protein